MRVLLAEPKKSKRYHISYPPLGLLKLAAYHQSVGDEVSLVRGMVQNGSVPDLICITSLFTYAWEAVHELVRFYADAYPNSEIEVGGIYATLCPDHIRQAFGDRVNVRVGLVEDVEDILPAYSLYPDCDESIIFSSRGCVRDCQFCSVRALEPQFKARKSVRHLVYPGHKRVVFWDNNFLASPYRDDIMGELDELGLEVDFNQGLDSRFLDEQVAHRLAKLKLRFVRLAYDQASNRKVVREAIKALKLAGFRGRRISVYCLYNFSDGPDDFLSRVRDLLDWGVVAYPMRYEPLQPQPKNTYVSSGWTPEELDMIAKARRVIGYGGAFPPYEALRRKICDAVDFDAAFGLRPVCQSQIGGA
jgi:hypothetical protein